jgi:transcriptional regulator with XRE-family HTH domain
MPSTTKRRHRPVGTGAGIAGQLREIIGSRDLTAYSVAHAAGVAPSVVSRFLSRERGLTLETFDAIAGALGLRLVETAKGRTRPLAKTARPSPACQPAMPDDQPPDVQAMVAPMLEPCQSAPEAGVSDGAENPEPIDDHVECQPAESAGSPREASEAMAALESTVGDAEAHVPDGGHLPWPEAEPPGDDEFEPEGPPPSPPEYSRATPPGWGPSPFSGPEMNPDPIDEDWTD